MKVVSKFVDEFKPFDITLRVETKEEAQNLFAIFNLPCIAEIFTSNTDTRDIRDEIRPHLKGPYEPGMERLKASIRKHL